MTMASLDSPPVTKKLTQCGDKTDYNFLTYREFCIILTDDANATAADCITLYFIGFNDDAPVVTYQSEGVVSFTEGQTNFVPIVNGTVNVTDADHPR